MEFKRHNYLRNNLIAYLGNKRRLLPFIEKSLLPIASNGLFVDYFAGSGSVSRLASVMGYEVLANDWEYYSYILNRAHLSLSKENEERIFEPLGGIESVANILNNIEDLPEEKLYIAKYYAPMSDENPNLDNERMFYTRANALRIDRIREQIETWRKNKIICEDGFVYLLASLLYASSTSSNTSGVFKGFHRGFGGKNKDALGRIFKPVEVGKIPLWDGRGKAFRENANVLAERLSNEKVHTAYIDPPYNQHQYGSNYHLLNTIAYWDKPEVNKGIYVDGKKTNKSAIRKDWVKTRSDYCYKQSALQTFANLIESIKAEYIAVSYSTDGHIGIDEMLSILEKKGKLSVNTETYVRYRGAKQSVVNETKNVEYLFIVETAKSSTSSIINKFKRDKILGDISLNLNKVVKTKIDMLYDTRVLYKNEVFISNKDEILSSLLKAPINVLKATLEKLEDSVARDKFDEIETYIKTIEKSGYEKNIFISLMPHIQAVYNKINGRRGRDSFDEYTNNIFTLLSEVAMKNGSSILKAKGVEAFLFSCEKRLNEGMSKNAFHVKHMLFSFKSLISSEKEVWLNKR